MNAAVLEGLFGALKGIPHLPGALCRGEAPLFDHADDPGTAEHCAQICRRCPELVPCRSWAATLSNRQLSGVVGGVVREWDPQSRRRKAS